MANFYATYPASNPSSISVTTVQGEGTAGSQTGGILTIQGDPSGTPVPISGNITASSASVAPTGIAVPADADYVGMNVGGNLTGMTGTANGLNVVVNAAIPAGSNVIGAVTQSGAPWTVTGTGTAGTPAAGVISIQGITSGTAVKVDPSGGTGATNITQFGGTNISTGAGAGGAGIPRVTVSNDSSMTSVGTVTTVSTVTTVAAVTAITNALPAGTNLLGKTGIDQTTPGTTNAIQLVSGTTAAWQAEGAVAFGSITNAFVTLFTPSANTKMLFMRNNTNAAISVSMDVGVTTNFTFDSGDQIAIDFLGNGIIAATAAIQIKYAVGAPTSGSFRINGCH